MSNFLRSIFPSQQKLPTLNITMLGPSGVGKTSLLAAMYDQFENVSKDLQLIPDQDSKSILDMRLNELKSFVGDSIKVRGGISQTGEPRSFQLEFGEIGTSPSLKLNFQDYPGEYIEQTDKIEEVKKFIRDSAAVLIPIDTPALMERDGKYHDKFNQPSELNNLFKDLYKNLDSRRLVILAPVKCEKYMQNTPELFRKVKAGYQPLLNKFASDKLLPKVAVIITPVQTVGSVIFSRIEEENNELTFYYRKPNPTDPYKPKNSEQPLKYLLRFLLKSHFDNQRKSVFSKIMLDFFGSNASLLNAVRKFSDPSSDMVEIVQSTDLFKL
ncbi:TRAFAC clade GTPase domain-containing protein [Limnoraphis robusta]|uniref:Double-GTPase 2 domain-containing protein n=1 Tax=Limnoraphis robusta CCNP1315 TaxID=3110306 RepID=A0ABU5TZB2_9CYAN|nr:hypothetical protein [Limnoraphis robusta]MEA5520271.1 hypothetical protein [Limnoraphis robusta CCNP1315]MEA5548537.1 hypothetical protein [Limnoraphis robusta CCNP1324]